MELLRYIEGNQVFEKVRDSARKLDLETYVIGGYVRDILLKRPSKDLDCVCVGDGIELAQDVAKSLGGLKVTVFKFHAMNHNEKFIL
jgi:tRNA nucleotidyltransferase/poly(A) polymerase